MMDELERRLRAARPAPGSRDLPLSDRAKREFAELVLSTPATPGARYRAGRLDARRRNRRIVGLTGAGATLVAAISLVFGFAQAPPATAMTPALLDVTEVDMSAHDLFTGLTELRRQDVPAPSDTIRAQTWVLNTTVNEDGDVTSSTVEPQWNQTTFQSDGTVRVQVTAADPFPGQDTAGLPAPGTVLAEETYQPGEYERPYPEPVPTNAGLIGDYLAQISGNDKLSVGEALVEISGIVSNVILDTDQETAILGYLSTLDGLTVAGEVTDRLGRPGVAVTAADRENGEVEDILILSTQTGKIVAAETVYVGSTRTDIRSPSVIDYAAWER